MPMSNPKIKPGSWRQSRTSVNLSESMNLHSNTVRYSLVLVAISMFQRWPQPRPGVQQTKYTRDKYSAPDIYLVISPHLFSNVKEVDSVTERWMVAGNSRIFRHTSSPPGHEMRAVSMNCSKIIGCPPTWLMKSGFHKEESVVGLGPGCIPGAAIMKVKPFFRGFHFPQFIVLMVPGTFPQ